MSIDPSIVELLFTNSFLKSKLISTRAWLSQNMVYSQRTFRGVAIPWARRPRPAIFFYPVDSYDMTFANMETKIELSDKILSNSYITKKQQE